MDTRRLVHRHASTSSFASDESRLLLLDPCDTWCVAGSDHVAEGSRHHFVWSRTGAADPSELMDLGGEQVFERRPLSDAGVPCPVCGREAWEVLVVRAPRESDYTRSHVVVCGSCRTIADRMPAGRRRVRTKVDPELQRELELARQTAPTISEPWQAVDLASFAVFAMDRALVRSARIASYSSQEGRILEVEVEHRARVGRRTDAVVISSSVADNGLSLSIPVPLKAVAVNALLDGLNAAAEIDNPSWKALSYEARRLRSQGQRRQIPAGAVLAESAEFSQMTIPVSQSDIDFMIARHESGTWVGVATVNGVAITATGDQFDPSRLRLVRVSDGGDYFRR
jgi:hypothetical protein